MGLLKTAAKVAVASSVHGRVQRRQQQRWAEQDQRAVATPPGVPGAGLAAPGTGVSTGPADLSHQLELIRQLNELRTSGALTDTEFEEKKRQILQA